MLVHSLCLMQCLSLTAFLIWQGRSRRRSCYYVAIQNGRGRTDKGRGTDGLEGCLSQLARSVSSYVCHTVHAERDIFKQATFNEGCGVFNMIVYLFYSYQGCWERYSISLFESTVVHAKLGG